MAVLAYFPLSSNLMVLRAVRMGLAKLHYSCAYFLFVSMYSYYYEFLYLLYYSIIINPLLSVCRLFQFHNPPFSEVFVFNLIYQIQYDYLLFHSPPSLRIVLVSILFPYVTISLLSYTHVLLLCRSKLRGSGYSSARGYSHK